MHASRNAYFFLKKKEYFQNANQRNINITLNILLNHCANFRTFPKRSIKLLNPQNCTIYLIVVNSPQFDCFLFNIIISKRIPNINVENFLATIYLRTINISTDYYNQSYWQFINNEYG